MGYTSEIIGAVFDDMPVDFEDPRDTAARELPGANFASVYGFAIYRQARQELRQGAGDEKTGGTRRSRKEPVFAGGG